MATDTSDGSAVRFEEIASDMGEHRRSILSLLDGGGDDESPTRMNSQEIRQATGVSPGSIRHHLRRLSDEWGLIEEVNREHTPGGGSPAKVYALTERGHQYVGSEPIGQTHRPLSPEEIVKLQERVDALESEVEHLRGVESDLNELRGEVNQIQSAFGEVRPTIDKIIRRIKDGSFTEDSETR